jgi:hypothetical protein
MMEASLLSDLPSRYAFISLFRKPSVVSVQSVVPIHGCGLGLLLEWIQKSCRPSFHFGAGGDAAIFNCSVGVPADEWFDSRHNRRWPLERFRFSSLRMRRTECRGYNSIKSALVSEPARWRV